MKFNYPRFEMIGTKFVVYWTYWTMVTSHLTSGLPPGRKRPFKTKWNEKGVTEWTRRSKCRARCKLLIRNVSQRGQKWIFFFPLLDQQQLPEGYCTDFNFNENRHFGLKTTILDHFINTQNLLNFNQVDYQYLLEYILEHNQTMQTIYT